MARAERTVRTLCALAAWGALMAAPAATGASMGGEDCAPWPGEPTPLATLADPDPVRARWAELRIAELSGRARLLEEAAAIEAHLLWRRVLCLDPDSEAARRGVARTRPVRVHRPSVVAADRDGAATPGRTLDPWGELATRVPVPLRPAHPPRPPVLERASSRADRERQLERIEHLLRQTDQRVRAARFEEALGSASQVRSRLAALGAGDDLRAHRVRLEVLAATALIALGREQAARESLMRAIAADPGLEFDLTTTSPKLLRALEAARAARERNR